jgi:hypothetical protein
MRVIVGARSLSFPVNKLSNTPNLDGECDCDECEEEIYRGEGKGCDSIYLFIFLPQLAYSSWLSSFPVTHTYSHLLTLYLFPSKR